jgi:hypothetical protein
MRALTGDPLSTFSLEERFTWASKRQITRAEDRAYSLLAILDVRIPLIYGEGQQNAFARLEREIKVVHGRHRSPMSAAEISTRHQYQSPLNPPLTKHVHGTRRGEPHLPPPMVPYDRPLAGNSFRLLVLDPGKLGSTITGHIQEFDLSDPPAYIALRHVWGPEPALHRVYINNTAKMIKPNLFHALGRIRALQKVQFRIWIDSLCINQLDDTERNAQVKRMSQVFNNADAVFIWLGEEDTTSKNAIELVTEIYKHTSGPLANADRLPEFFWDRPGWKMYGFTALSILLERTWFRRGWVLQEAAFSTSSVIQCGDRQIHMTQFTFVANLIRERLSSNPRAMSLESDRTRVGTLMNFLDSPAVKMLDMIEGVFDRSLMDGKTNNPTMPLETLVHLSTFSETFDEQDAIYSLLNLANDTSSPLHRIIPDYRKSILGVYTDFIMHCFHHSESLDILCRPWAPVPSSHAQNDREDSTSVQSSLMLPSWVASRDNLPYGDPSLRLKHRIHGNCLVGSSSKRTYNAHCGSKPILVKWPTEDRPYSLFVKGFVLTEVSRRSSRMANSIVTTECLEILVAMSCKRQIDYEEYSFPDSIWRTLCADRDNKGERAPCIYRDAMLGIARINNGNHELHPDTSPIASRTSIDVEELLQHPGLSAPCKEFLLVARDVVWNRRTFRSKPLADMGKALVGLIPQNARVGDRICILYGCSVPVVLRKHIVPDEGYYWQLVGDAYVHGVMDGEAIERVSEEELQRKEMVFELR